MSFAFLALLLAVVWVVITGYFSLLNLFLGLAISVVALGVVRERISNPVFFRRARLSVLLAALFIYELTLSAVRVALLVLTPDLKKSLAPAIIEFPLTATSDLEITLLANLITLTPGTLSVDVTKDRKCLYVHAIQAENEKDVIKDIASGFESRIIEVFK